MLNRISSIISGCKIYLIKLHIFCMFTRYLFSISYVPSIALHKLNKLNEMTLFIQPNGKEGFYQAAPVGVLPSPILQILSFLIPPSTTRVLSLEERKICTHVLSHVHLYVTLWIIACRAPLCAGFFSGKNHGVGCHFLLQGIFLIQGPNFHLLCLLHRQADPLPLWHLKTTVCESQPFLSCWSKKGTETFWLICTVFPQSSIMFRCPMGTHNYGCFIHILR